ncbi:MAG: hypothetical protein RSE46_07330 [Janthinobacterium sp.]
MRRMIAASVARRIALKKMGAGALALATPMQVLSAVGDAASQYPAVAQQAPQAGHARALSAEGVLAPTQRIATEDAAP